MDNIKMYQMKTTTKMRVEHLPQRLLACVRHTGPYKGNSALFERLFTKVQHWAAPKGFLSDPNTEAITIYHDDSDAVPEEQQRISVGFTVPAGTPGEGDIHTLEMPQGNYLVGSFEILPTEYEYAWQEIMHYLTEENIYPTGIMYESYCNDPSTHPQGKHLVDICVQI